MSSIQRFYINSQFIQNSEVIIPNNLLHQIMHVLRLKPNDPIKFFDGSGKEYLAVLTFVSKKNSKAKILKTTFPETELPIQINLFHGLLKNKSEAILLQKSTELGAANFFPLLSKRSVNQKLNKFHFEKIIQEACEVVGRVKLPVLYDLQSLPNVFNSEITTTQFFSKKKRVLNLLAWEEKLFLNSLFATLEKSPFNSNNPEIINLFLGPEGGFEQNEIEFLKTFDISTVSLGKRILRAETAGILLISSLLAKFQLI